MNTTETTINTNTLDREVLGAVAAESLAKIDPARADAKRWTKAIAKAVIAIENNPFMSYDAATHSLLILSEQSGEIYTANGVCQCRAFQLGQPCYHRCAARLVAICLERMAR